MQNRAVLILVGAEVEYEEDVDVGEDVEIVIVKGVRGEVVVVAPESETSVLYGALYQCRSSE